MSFLEFGVKNVSCCCGRGDFHRWLPLLLGFAQSLSRRVQDTGGASFSFQVSSSLAYALNPRVQIKLVVIKI